MKILDFFFYFCGSFLPSWLRIRIRNLNADPATQINADPCGSGSETLFTVYCSPPPPWSGPGRPTVCRAPASSGARASRGCRRPAHRPAGRPAGCPGLWTGRTGSPRRCTGWWPAGGSPVKETNKMCPWIKGELMNPPPPSLPFIFCFADFPDPL